MPTLVAQLKGHSASVLCCQTLKEDEPNLIASSGEDGRVCIFDLRSSESPQKYESFGNTPVASICFHRGTEFLFYAAAGRTIFSFDTRLGPNSAELYKYTYNVDDINQLVINKAATFLAAADDSGETKVINMQNNNIFRTLRGVHTNICSSVQFHPQRSWELVTGGLDSKIVHWDFSRGKALAIMDISSAAPACNSPETLRMCNPPFVHALATDERWTNLMSVARGDGVIDIYDLLPRNQKKVNSVALDGKKSKSAGKPKAINPFSRLCYFDVEKGGHAAAASHVTFAKFSNNAALISGGNDGLIKIWNWCNMSKSSETSSIEQPIVPSGGLNVSIQHQKKVNWLTSTTKCHHKLIVADTSRRLTVYDIL